MSRSALSQENHRSTRRGDGDEPEASSASEEAEDEGEDALSDEVEEDEEDNDTSSDDDSDDDADDQEDEEQEDEEGEEAEDDEDEEERSDDADAAAGGGSRHRRRKRQRRAQRQRRGELEIVKLPRRTNKAAVQERERLDGGEALPNTKPMMELQAGSNVWYQAYVLKESLNEAKVRFPDPDGGRGDLLRTWVNKASSRIWRGSYAHGDWQFLGKGAWKPRQKPKRSARGSGRRGNGAAVGGGGGS
eukprot:jgi/Sobl393_1/12527/SZX60765.1